MRCQALLALLNDHNMIFTEKNVDSCCCPTYSCIISSKYHFLEKDLELLSRGFSILFPEKIKIR